MKKNLKQALVPLAVMVFGVAAAFATNAAKQSEKAFADVYGYHYDSTRPVGQQCQMLDVQCTDIPNENICRDSNEIQLWKSTNNGLTCTGLLYKIF